MKTLFITTLLVAGMLTTYTQACTRVVYLGKNWDGCNRSNHGLERRFKIQYLRVPQRNRESGGGQGEHDSLEIQIWKCHHGRDTTSVLLTG